MTNFQAGDIPEELSKRIITPIAPRVNIERIVTIAAIPLGIN